MKNTVTNEQLAARLAEVLNNESMAAEYGRDGLMYEGICGWAGVMSPLTRPAYIAQYGEAAVLQAEASARDIIADKKARHEKSTYYAHRLEADAHLAAGTNAPTKAGQFVWAICSGLKGESGYNGELRALVRYMDDNTDRREVLVKVEKIINVDDLPMSAADCNAIVTAHELRGGAASDDVCDNTPYWQQTEEQQSTYYTIAAAVIDKAGRWYLIDAEGYDYARYFYSPLTWREIYAGEVAAIRQQYADEQAEIARQAAEAKVKRRAEYDAKCAKWAKLMTEVEPYERAEREAAAVWRNARTSSKQSAEYKALKQARTKLNNVRRGNILAMARAAFPNVKFSLTKHDGWGADWTLTYYDGATLEEFHAATDLDLLRTYCDTFDGMTDYAGTEQEEFTDFAMKYMGASANSIEVERKMSDDKRKELEGIVCEIVPSATGVYGKHDYTPEEARAVADALGQDVATLFPRGFDRVYTSEIARRVFDVTSYCTPQATNSTPDKNDSSSEPENAPADGLALVEIANGVAVVGDSRTTYKNRKEIKARGARWNKAAQQWQATEPEAVANLRAWFESKGGNELAQ